MLVALTSGALLLPSASAGAENCFYAPASRIAKSLGLQHATAVKNIEPERLEFAGDKFSLCRAVAWSGSKPTSPAQAAAKVADGTGATIVIKTEEEFPGASGEELEKWHKQYEQQTSAFLLAGFAFGKQFHGKTISPPTYGAESDLAWTEASGPARGALGIWYDDKQFSYITIDITGGKPGRSAASLEKLAALAVASFGL
jgi:hypothetical protein